MFLLVTFCFIVLIFTCGYAYAFNRNLLVALLLVALAALASWQYLPYAGIFVPGSGWIVVTIIMLTFTWGWVSSELLYRARRKTNAEKPKETK